MKKFIVFLKVAVGVLLGKVSTQQLESILPPVGDEVDPVMEQVVKVVDPDWVTKHLTPCLEEGFSSGIVNPKLLLHKRQESGEQITGNEIFAWLLPDQDMYQVKEDDLINKCVELADIQFYEKYLHLISSEWKGKIVYAWKSVVLDDNGDRYVPFLDCNAYEPFVCWFNLDGGWDGSEPACTQE